MYRRHYGRTIDTYAALGARGRSRPSTQPVQIDAVRTPGIRSITTGQAGRIGSHSDRRSSRVGCEKHRIRSVIWASGGGMGRARYTGDQMVAGVPPSTANAWATVSGGRNTSTV